MDINEFLQAGSDICDDVREAIENNNYENLGNMIRERVNRATRSMYGSIPNQPKSRYGGSDPKQSMRYNSRAQQDYGQGYARGQRVNVNAQPWSSPSYGQTAAQQRAAQQRAAQQRAARPVSYFMRKPLSRGLGTGESVFGVLGLAVFGIAALVSVVSVLSGIFGDGQVLLPLFSTAFNGSIAAGSFLFFRRGKKKSRLVNRYYQLGNLLGSAEYFSVRQVASRIGISEDELRKDLKEMMAEGYLPQARFDAQESTLILTDHAWALYSQAESSRLEREQAERQKAEAEKALSAQEREVRQILSRGTAYLRHVREVNDVIPDTDEMSNKLYRLEEIMHRIFEQVEKQPTSASGLRRFMDYYLPTTEKLLDAYVELDRQPNVGDNITKTKHEIEDAMDTINDAFEKLLDSLFEDVAWDISSDISVMKTMMKQDGLTENELQQMGGMAAQAEGGMAVQSAEDAEFELKF